MYYLFPQATINFELGYKCPTQGEDDDCFESDEDQLDMGDEDDDEQAFVPPPSLPSQYVSTNLTYPSEASDTLSPRHQPIEMHLSTSTANQRALSNTQVEFDIMPRYDYVF